MYLKKMEIIGFKSFAQRTVLEFHDGITIVVGPNGCGKSNVLDSLRWALGEKSAKTLRGQSMTDVIFSGTQQLPPANYAEVTLTFSNEDKSMDIAYDEVSITRKLYRSGESEYYLNKNKVRLRDIHELLLSVGLGEGSYSFVMQGTIDRILTQKPEQKRVIFDEAAGILQFKERKREVTRKLKDAEDNLLRVDDIIIEVKRQRDSLARQVQRAKKYQELRTELEALEKNLAVVKMQGIRQRMESLLEELSGIEQGDGKAHVQMETLQGICAEKNEQIEELRRDQEEKNREIITFESRIENSNHKIEISNQRIAEAQQRLDSIFNFKQQYTNRKDDQQRRIEQLRKELDDLENTHLEVNDRVSSIQLEIDAAREFVNGKSDSIDFIKDRIKQIEEEKDAISVELRELYKQIDSAAVHKQRISNEDQKIQSELDSFKQRYNQLLEDIKVKEEEIASLQTKLLEKQSQINHLQAEIESSVTDLSDKEKDLLLLSSQVDFLKNMNVSYQDLPYEEEVTVEFSKEIPTIPAVLVGRVEEKPTLGDNGAYSVRTNVKVISSNIEQMQEDIDGLEKSIAELKISISNKRLERNDCESDLGNIRRELGEKENSMSRLKESQSHVLNRMNELSSTRETFAKELSEIEVTVTELEEKEIQIQAKLKDKDSSILDVSQELEMVQEQISLKQQQLNDLEVEKATIHTRLTTIEGEKSGKAENVRIFTSDLATLSEQFEALGTEEAELKEKRQSFSLGIQDVEEEVLTLSDELIVKREALQNLVMEEKELAQQRELSENRLREIEFEIEAAQKKVYDKKFELQNIKHEEEQIVRDLMQLYEIEVSVDELLEQEAVDVPLNEMTTQEEELKRRLKYIGSVNLDAPREYEELNERYDFLVKQKEDLIESKETLRKALLKINKTSKEMFLETFNQITAEFKVMFRFLFGGGKADVVLLDPDNVLDSGVDIIVQPPGKKLQNVSLLSGGEKSMTAIALIFAIFKIKPSPFCVLDEIDAALDEANVDRYNHVLRDFAKMSQFLVISHNKKTIGVADFLYGVTMQQSGISKIVSVRLSEEESDDENKITHTSEHGHDKMLDYEEPSIEEPDVVEEAEALVDDQVSEEDDIVDGELTGASV